MLELYLSKIAMTQEMCENSSSVTGGEETPLSEADMVRGKNNRSSKLPDQSEGSGRTW